MHLPPQLAHPTESVLTPRFRPCSCRGGHSGPVFARALRSLRPFSTIPFGIRTYVEHTRKPCRIRTSKTQDLKPFRIRTYVKIGGGGVIIVN
jgi:hypothetical protein